MKKAYYRVRQAVMNIVIRILLKKNQKVISGEGSLVRVAGSLKKNGKKSVLVVTIPEFITWGTLDEFFKALEDNGVKLNLYAEVSSEPTVELVEKGVKLYREGKCDAIVAIGGGSVLDCAKAIGARITRPDKTIRDLRGTLKIRKKLPEFYAAPTTAGTGSETTAVFVITDTIDGTHYKYSVNDFCLVPEYAVLDPMLTRGLPPKVTAYTGMDALTHAVESYTNKWPSKYVKEKAITATKLIFENIYEAYEHGDNLKARENMLMGSYCAGVAFTTNFVGYVHAIAHGIGGLYGIPHGEANAIVLPYVLEAFGSSVYKSLGELGREVGIDGESDREIAGKFIEAIKDFNSRMGIASRVEALREEDFEELIKRAIKEANPLYPTPEIWGHDEFEKVLKALCNE